MKRRKNFLFSGPKPYEVRIYIYGKGGYEARGEQNIKRKQFDDIRAAKRWMDANVDYPLVELVDLKKGNIIFSGGTGRFNPRKKKPRVPKRRDAYAEMAKARKTTSGHKRKDRKRAVAKGASRKPKHKMRLNPFTDYDKPYKGQALFDTNVKKRHDKLFSIYRGFLAALEEEKVENLPSPVDLRDDAMRGAVLIESIRYPDLRSQSRATEQPGVIAKEVLGIGPGGEFAPYTKKYSDIFKTQLRDITEIIRQEKKKLRESDSGAERKVEDAKDDAALRALDAEEARRKAPKKESQTYSSDSDEPINYEEQWAQKDQNVSVGQREQAAQDRREEEPLDPAQAEALRKRTRSQSRARRISRYEGHVSETRRTDVAPPVSVVAGARQDVLLYALKDGTTQVWSKGAITETFLPSKKTPSVTFAHRYANWWRGLDGRGRIRDGAKKSRLRSRVLLAVEGKKGVKEIEPSIVQSLGHVQQDVIGTHELPNLDKYELKGDRANPRSRRKGKMVEVDFYIDHEYDSNRHKYVERLFAFRDGQPYRVALTRIKELYGEGPKGMDGTSTMMSESDWRYLRPVKAKVASGGSETGHIYNPRRRRNYVAPSGGERKTRVFFMETRGKKYNVKVYKAGSVYEVVIYERGAPSKSFITSDKNEVWATVGHFYKVGHMTGTAKYRVKQDNLGLGIE